jgi:hypothetical protein
MPRKSTQPARNVINVKRFLKKEESFVFASLIVERMSDEH